MNGKNLSNLYSIIYDDTKSEEESIAYIIPIIETQLKFKDENKQIREN